MNYVRESWLRWVAWLLLAVLFAIACAFLANWQFSRRTEALAKVNQVATLYDRQPVEISNTKFNPKDEWLPVKLTGRFLPEKTLLVRNRPLNGAPGFLTLIPFEREDGLLVGIEAGWVPADSRLNPPQTFPKPTGDKQTITGHIRPSETTLNRDAPAGQIATLNVATLFEKSGLTSAKSADFYVRLSESNFSQAGLPKLLSRPQLTEGNHLSYALQWIVFAIMAFMALVWAVRQEIRFKRMADDPNYRPKVRKKVGDDDNAAEDIIILSA
jgi:cytochrome oxidase assembly protein ShyY1